MNDSVKNETPLTENTETEASIPIPKKIQVVPNWRKVFSLGHLLSMLCQLSLLL